MRPLSRWAKFHPRKARAAIISIKLILSFLAYLLSHWLAEVHWNIFPSTLITVSAIFFITAMLFYPNRFDNKKSRRLRYIHRKTCDLILGSSTFLMMLGIINSSARSLVATDVFASTPSEIIKENPGAARILASLRYRDKRSLTHHEKRILKREFGTQLKLYVQQKVSRQNENADKTILILLTIIAAVGLTILLAALSCSIACGGAEGLAVLVFLAGLVGIAIGVTKIMINIKRHYDRKKKSRLKESPKEETQEAK